MGYKVTLNNPSKTTGQDPDKLSMDRIRMSRMTYQLMGSLVKNKTILADFKAGNLPPEYMEILNQFNILAGEKYYPNLTTEIPTPEIRALDSYLGSLGIDIEYPYSKDKVNIKPWIEPGKQNPIRVLFDEDDTTYLIDPSDGTVLMQYT